ncbi:hypothetical protein [Dyadobacter frigoris]|uniref:hypothetical protein n=1 Tax=Dyadobacter frigoris TaxID=2576211 RepID=UPI001485093A|nr:hypothetical protein [Dyadobacter frigoris]GLU53246.1 hypothetical protein Dfri01_27070 [Dyadobacter frigoris]
MKTTNARKSIKKQKTETDTYFSDPNVMNSIKEGIEDIKAGRITEIKDVKNIWADIL